VSTDIATRFAKETAEHRMTVLHDDGLYRHLRFQPRHSFYWFELITVPGSLTFRGDGESFVFARVEDMFEFFRGQRVNPMYWAEKVTSGRETLTEYDEAKFVEMVEYEFASHHEFNRNTSGLARAIISEVLDDEVIGFEQTARDAVDQFKHDGFRFYDTWEWSLRSYSWWFLWALHGIVWGIAQYDAWKAPLPEEWFA
jgi:hypothetical protein